MSNSTAKVVELTFKRIQQFLFAVPRLKAMKDANALLGETIREELVNLLLPARERRKENY